MQRGGAVEDWGGSRAARGLDKPLWRSFWDAFTVAAVPAILAQANGRRTGEDQSMEHRRGDDAAVHWVSSIADVAEHFYQTSMLWLRAQERFVVTQRLELDLSLRRLADMLHGDGWEGLSGAEDLTALSRQQRLLVRAVNAGPRLGWHDGDRANADPTTEVMVTGAPEPVHAWCARFRETAAHPRAVVRWVFSNEDSPLVMPMRQDRVPHPLMFPFLPQPLPDLYDAFARSDAPVLVLLGPPGTGKTSFIRGFLQHTRMDAMMSFDRQLLDRDEIFARFLGSSTPVFVLEDADVDLRARESVGPASMMHRFLVVSDGLVSVRDKKLIFSTNLPNLRDVDEALLRPGRCFAVLHFRALEPAEGLALADAMGWSVRPDDPQPRTLAEWFALQQASSESSTVPPGALQKVGFV